MKRMLLWVGVGLTLPLAGWAQARLASVPAPVSRFYTADYQPTTPADSTALCVETTYRDSLGAGLVRVYFPSGRLKQYIPYANVARSVRHGCLSTWYENGQMCSKEDFVNGQRHGELLTYYPNGTLRRREQYVNGRCGVGLCYSPAGFPVPYFTYEQLPLYPGGEAQLLKELTKAVRLNRQEMAAMRAGSYHYHDVAVLGWRRQVDVELAVTPEGRVARARVVYSSAGFLNNAALRAVAQLKRQFIPGRRDGQALLSYLTVPVYYTLEMPSQAPRQGAYDNRYRTSNR